MSTYNFTMRNYHAVKEANIEIAGLTVVGGVNGCGKSTLARWLNYVVNVLNNYDASVIKEARANYRILSDTLSRATSISPTLRWEWIKEDQSSILSGELDEMRDSFILLVRKFTEFLQTKLKPKMWEINRKRLSSLFNLEEIAGETLPSFIVRVEDYLMTEGEEVYAKASSRIGHHTLRNWKEILLDNIDLTIDDTKIDLRFSEDGVILLNDKDFSIPLMLHNAVYINTQEISSAFGYSETGNGALWQLLQKKSDQISPKNQSLAKMIRRIIDGDVVVNTRLNRLIGRRDRLHYVRQDGLDILLRGAATGIISFSILLQLLENGWITENSLLIIDEPEAHLHPQWIVEYARVLVKIKKILGTKIFISTHNPDMLAALQAISDNEDTLNETLFYLAEKEENNKFVYRNLGKNIGPIFDSFNIALDRIELYGKSSSED